jgi:hypothetical protein
MKYANLSFSYPVLGTQSAKTQTHDLGLISLVKSPNSYDIEFTSYTVNEKLLELINNDQIIYMAHVQCSSTLFRKSWFFKDKGFSIQIPAVDLLGLVEIDFLLVSRVDIKNYSNDYFLEEYQEYSFQINKNDPLAVLDKKVFDIDIDYKNLKAVSSIMSIEIGETDVSRISLEGSKIVIKLPLDQYEIFSFHLNKDPRLEPVFHSSIVLNALILALLKLGEYEDNLWARSIRYRLDNESELMNLDSNDPYDAYELAQLLMGRPYKRLFIGEYSLLNTFYSYNDDLD